ncbi:DnaJ domain-containing protein [Synechococcales cyanobacterium C]|uniref:DnaJ domain-containing protein n=1 Tax=Petrachloros mirabilis ULC683 TaxID=2781853 RepID=A0A8K2A7E3_9CYAN|nr:J domain-containing protein [Petrachloros mirabilis]NCJ06114.1 DnaJ domain-containing protein [Petrachloros mirabilis ULC683]
MDIADCYRLLELKSTANLEEVKSSYRRLARRWHPDVNPGNQNAQEMFIRITQAYERLVNLVPTVTPPRPTDSSPSSAWQPSPSIKVSVQNSPPEPVKTPNRDVAEPPPSPASASPDPQSPAPLDSDTPEPPPLSLADQELKHNAYQQLQEFIKHKRFPRAIALLEALNHRLPHDPEVRQWQAIIYQRWGRQLILDRKLNQARAYLRKALNTDPHNKSLWAEVEQDFRSMEKIF